MTTDDLVRIERLIKETVLVTRSNARAILANTESINEIAEASGRTLRAVEILRESVEEGRVNLREHVEQTNTAITGINATLTVLQQMMRRWEYLED